MAVRTTEAAVALIIEVDDNIALTSFIEVSNDLVTRVCADSDYMTANGYDATTLELIERWLAAHFYAVRDPRTTQEKAGPVAATYESKVDLNLAITRYGQQAMLIDTGGALAALNGRVTKGKAKITPSVTYLGVEDWDTANI